jgi:LPS-assembly lipoprotein
MQLSKFKLLFAPFLTAALLLQGCGWHLRGAEPIPTELQTLHLQAGSANNTFTRALKRSFSAMDVDLTETAAEAPYTLSVSPIHNERRVLSTTGTAKVAEYLITSSLVYSVIDTEGEERVHPTRISVEKTYLYNRDNAISAYEEESLLREEMQRDLIQQLLRRYRALQPATDVSAK